MSRCIACDLWGGAAGYLNDLHVLEPLSNMWSDLSGTARGIAPLARSGVGMEAIADRLYVYGGQGPGAVGGRLGGVMGCVGCADLCMRLVRGVRKDLCGCWGAMRCARASAARLHPGPGCAPVASNLTSAPHHAAPHPPCRWLLLCTCVCARARACGGRASRALKLPLSSTLMVTVPPHVFPGRLQTAFDFEFNMHRFRCHSFWSFLSRHLMNFVLFLHAHVRVAGFLAGFFNNMFVFDLQESTWSELNTSGSVPYGRSDMGTAALGDKIYVFGGWSNSKGSLLPCTSPPDHDAQSDHDALRRGVLAPRASPCLALMTFAILSLARERALRLVACARTLTRASEAEAAHPPWDLTCLALACRGCCSVLGANEPG